MSKQAKQAFRSEMAAAHTARRIGNMDTAFIHLERAHILGQRYFLAHWITHWGMLQVGLARRDGREIFGQITRLIAVIPGWVFGWVPKGNTGGANVSPVRPMAYPRDLAPLLADYSLWRDVAKRIAIFAILALGFGIAGSLAP